MGWGDRCQGGRAARWSALGEWRPLGPESVRLCVYVWMRGYLIIMRIFSIFVQRERERVIHTSKLEDHLDLVHTHAHTHTQTHTHAHAHKHTHTLTHTTHTHTHKAQTLH